MGGGRWRWVDGLSISQSYVCVYVGLYFIRRHTHAILKHLFMMIIMVCCQILPAIGY